MFRKALHDEIRNIFKLTPIDWAGALHDGSDNVYVEYLNVREQYFSESHIRFFGTIRLSLADMGRDKPVFGVLGSKFDRYKKAKFKQQLFGLNQYRGIVRLDVDWRTFGVKRFLLCV
ncbi:hypothetical protein H9K57_08410 [Vibrio parahaemolyticus]|uniref:hypothetical protein n=1 Tax=Vibrio parahaemolyticus TaxID=670 RepID=UPI0020523517|nr:hypothetical protein [Vibrio parahaemolyticus]UPR37623.1 hypothetical protein H9K57_08410 [Vibrio parahaemolyticus]